MSDSSMSRRAAIGTAAAATVGTVATQAMAQTRSPSRRSSRSSGSTERCFCTLLFPDFNSEEFLSAYDEYAAGGDDRSGGRSRGEDRFLEFIVPFIPTLVDVIADAVRGAEEERNRGRRGADIVTVTDMHTPRRGEEPGPLSRAGISVTLSF